MFKKLRAKRLHIGGAAALAVATVGGFEGLRQTAYPDPATRGHPWTVCYGHTGPDVHRGDKRSIAECKDLLLHDLDTHAAKLEPCIKVALPDGRYVALLSLAINIGPAGVCRSSALRLINEGRVREGCDALLRFNRAAGFVMPGLTRRRQAERALCLRDE